MSSRFCNMMIDELFYGYVCRQCHRHIAMTTIRNHPTGVMALVCGVPSEYDMAMRNPRNEPQRYEREHVSVPVAANELIGQEGGRFDAMYLEEP